LAAHHIASINANHGPFVLAGSDRTPTSLERIIVQQGVRTALWAEWFELISHYEERLIIVPLEGDHCPIARQRQELEPQWLDRIDGGSGCWSLGDVYECTLRRSSNL
jgi:hypothetical protein